MHEALYPKTLSDVAVDLQTDPFEILKLLVLGEVMPSSLYLTDAHIERVTELGGFESLLDRDSIEFQDGFRVQDWVIKMISVMVERELFDSNATRSDNLWRNLEKQEAIQVESTVEQLVNEGLLKQTQSPYGEVLSLVADKKDTLEALVSGAFVPESLAYLWRS
jgi:hypothetical protein